MTCPICQSPTHSAFTSGGYRMYRCVECKTAFVAPQPDAGQLRTFYSEFHRSDDEGGWYDQLARHLL